ncbi:MAG: DUF87 domain-containing protein [Ignisphaera sp.]
MDLDYGSKVYWDPRSTITSHVFIVGPSGSGKSVALSTLSYRIAEKFKSVLTVFDVKAEHYHLLKFSGLDVREFNPLKTPLPLCFCDDSRVNSEQNINAFLKVFQKVYGISSSLYRTLYENIKYICYRCEPVERLYDVVENIDALNDLVKVFEVYPSRGSDPVEGVLNGHSVFNLKEVFLGSTALSSFIIYYTIDRILRNANLSFSNTPQRVVVLDELWHVAPHIIDELIQILTRYSRGYGIAFFMATQSIDDVGVYADAISGSSALLLAMASPTHSYWSRISRYLNLSRKGVDRAVKLSGQGECVVRMYPFEAPMFIYMDPLES